MFYFDLHLHTSASDGALDFRSLFALCRKRGLRGLAVTDHHCSVPYRDLSESALLHELEIIPAVEIKTSCRKSLFEYAGEGFAAQAFAVQELLIYGLDTENSEFLSLSRRHFKYRREYVRRLCALLSERRTSEIEGLDFDEPLILDEKEILAGDGYVGSERVISWLVDFYGSRANRTEWGRSEVKSFVVGLSFEAISDLGDPFYHMDLFEGLRLAKNWGAMVVLAHPLASLRKDFCDFYREFLFPRLAEAGLDGLECSYPEHGLEQEAFLRSEANKYHFIMTGGSDFHNFRDDRYLPGTCGVNEETFRQVKSRSLIV